jgi:VanZ family protein
VVAYCALIFLLSGMETLPESASAIPDKVAHVILYSGLGFLVARWLRRSKGRTPFSACCIATVFCLLYGSSDEFHQYFVPGRTMEVGDVFADVLGGLLGSMAYCAIFPRSRPSREAGSGEKEPG